VLIQVVDGNFVIESSLVTVCWLSGNIWPVRQLLVATQQKPKGYSISVETYLTHNKRSHCIIA